LDWIDQLIRAALDWMNQQMELPKELLKNWSKKEKES